MSDEDEKARRKGAQGVKLELKDYVALTIAGLETFLLPLVILIAVLAALALILSLRP